MNAHIVGTGSFLPPDVLTNDDLSEMVDTSDEWIRTRTGIRERRMAHELTTLDMAIESGRRALAQSGLSPEDIGVLVVATVTPENRIPSIACDLQHHLGLVNSFCFDLNAACTGFIYALDIAARYIRTGFVKHALVVSSEKLSSITDYTDRTTCILFGDGSGAAALSAREGSGGFLGSYLGAKGDLGAALSTPVGGTVEMNGQEVYKFAVKAMPMAIDRVLEETGLSMDDIDFVIPHQANVRILKSVQDKHNIPPEKMIMTLEQYGNISSSGIPVSLDELHRQKRIRNGDKILMVGFGGGLTYGATVFEWSGEP